MPRPSLKAKRRAGILDAYGRCIARYGVEGATLERTATEADLARALIRHNVGNKDDLLEAFLDRFLGHASKLAESLFESLPQENRVATMIEWLFDPKYSNADDVRITNALLTAATERPALAKRLLRWTAGFVESIATELKDAYPAADDETIQAVATGVSSIYFSFDTLMPLAGEYELRQSAETAAGLLVSVLDAE